jgi:hypothetical protein
MIELTADEAANEFSQKLRGEKFTLARSPNSEEVYAAEKLGRDMAAIDEFLKNDEMVEYIRNLK